MPDRIPKNWLNSKEILLKTGISRATLNNYIKMGIIPRPVVERPKSDVTRAKRIGYFPHQVLERIKLVNALKGNGHSMEEIANQLRDIPVGGYEFDHGLCHDEFEEWVHRGMENGGSLNHGALRLTFESIRLPAYLLNYGFQIRWANEEAEEEILGQGVRISSPKSIFKVLFHWEFHSRVRNWRDVVALHMSFVKAKYARSWMENLYEGVSRNEALILQDIYDRVEAFPGQTIKDTTIDLLMEGGTTKSYKVYNILFKEGIFFLYANENLLD